MWDKMKTKIIPLIGDPFENLYQLGLRERDAFLNIEERVTKLLSTNPVLQFSQDVISRARMKLRKKDESFFESSIASYSEGLGIDPARYFSFLSLLELAAHSGQVFPELKGLLPGCTSVLEKKDNEITHTRLIDFPLIGLFDTNPRLYYWQSEGKEAVLSYSCEGLAPLFFQGIHGSGVSFALHHKPGKSWHKDGQSAFQIAFETIMDGNNFNDFKRELKRQVSMTKWNFLLLDKSGQVLSLDIDGPAQNFESFNLNDTSQLIFTNIPLQQDSDDFRNFIHFSEARQNWTKDKLNKNKNAHILDLLTDIKDQKIRGWKHPAATLATVGAWHVNLSKGFIDLKEGEGALTSSDLLLRIDLRKPQEAEILKAETPKDEFEISWKRASFAQSAFDRGEYDLAYHELQMALALMPHQVWKDIFSFYLYLWDFKFIGNNKELSLVYRKVKELNVPDTLKDQWLMFIMRLEKKLDLSPTVNFQNVSPHLQKLFQQERLAGKPLFATWMKLIYPRMEILDVFSPHHK